MAPDVHVVCQLILDVATLLFSRPNLPPGLGEVCKISLTMLDSGVFGASLKLSKLPSAYSTPEVSARCELNLWLFSMILAVRGVYIEVAAEVSKLISLAFDSPSPPRYMFFLRNDALSV